jgi:AraC family transcriptional regulator
MLMYFGSGTRDYHRRAIGPRVRPYWEFQAVVAGKAAPVLGPEPGGAWFGRSLWVFPPGMPHGWASPPGRPCRVAVFHFEPDDIDPLLHDACRRAGQLRVNLRPCEVTSLGRLTAQLQQHHPTTTRLTPLLVERLRAELCWIAAAHLGPRAAAAPPDDDEVRARQALAWFSEHLGRRVGVAEVAAALHLSPGHLRKIFRSAGLPPPQQMLTDIRLERVKDLLRRTDLSLADIAAAVGFSGPTVLCRRFRDRLGTSPRAWASNHRDPAPHPAAKRRATTM